MFRRFLKSFLRKRGFRITSYESVNFSHACLDRFTIMSDLYSVTRQLPGCIVELGYGYGISFSALAYLSQGDGKNIYSYDSFKGFPNPTFHDFSSRTPRKGEWSHRTSQEANKQMIEFGLVNFDQLHFIEGFVEETLDKELPSEEICFLHIDLDLYSGYRMGLEKLWPLMTYGGIVLFDEYNDDKWPGATQAINEFLRKNSLKIQRHPLGKYYLKKVNTVQS